MYSACTCQIKSGERQSTCRDICGDLSHQIKTLYFITQLLQLCSLFLIVEDKYARQQI